MSDVKDKKNSKKIILCIILVVVVALAVVISLIIVKNMNKVGEVDEMPYQPPEETGENYVVYDGVKSNNSMQFRQPKTYGIYSISSAVLTCQNNESKFLALVSIGDDQKEKVEGKPIKINMLDKDGKVKFGLKAYMPDVMPGETVVLESMINVDIVDVYDFEVVDDDDIVKE